MTLDEFFRCNYGRMVGYCSSWGYNVADAEEVVADVIYRYFDDYTGKVSAEGHAKYRIVRAWMNRRARLDLCSLYVKLRRRNEDTGKDVEQLEDVAPDQPVPESQVHYDTPENIFCLKQRLPAIHPLLIDYEPVRKGQGRVEAASARSTPNTSADKTRFCREKAKLLAALAA